MKIGCSSATGILLEFPLIKPNSFLELFSNGCFFHTVFKMNIKWFWEIFSKANSKWFTWFFKVNINHFVDIVRVVWETSATESFSCFYIKVKGLSKQFYLKAVSTTDVFLLLNFQDTGFSLFWVFHQKSRNMQSSAYMFGKSGFKRKICLISFFRGGYNELLAVPKVAITFSMQSFLGTFGSHLKKNNNSVFSARNPSYLSLAGWTYWKSFVEVTKGRFWYKLLAGKSICFKIYPALSS